MRLFRKDFCPYCARVEEKLRELGLSYEEVEVPGPHSERDRVHELTGQRKVPVLVDGDEVVHDSSRIVKYLDENYG